MRTRLMIMAIVLASATGAIGTVVLLVVALGWLGLPIAAFGIVAVLGAYRLWIQPWQHRWGATDAEVHRAMPGDDLIPDATSTTRAIGIVAPAEQVWPWLVQLGYGRGGWYSYDWIDNDGQPSADRIIPELQQLHVGDQILMHPDMGLGVREVEPNRYLVAGDEGGGTWCLALYPAAGGCRLVSRWRVNWPLTLATAFWILLSDPGAFIMERKMLKGIRFRAEATVQDREQRLLRVRPLSVTGRRIRMPDDLPFTWWADRAASGHAGRRSRPAIRPVRPPAGGQLRDRRTPWDCVRARPSLRGSAVVRPTVGDC